MSGNWQNKLYHHEEAPPKGLWDSIAGELDKQSQDPAVNTLNETTQTNEKSVSFKRAKIIRINYRKLIQIAGMILIIAATGIWFIAKQPSEKKQIAVVQNESVKPGNNSVSAVKEASQPNINQSAGTVSAHQVTDNNENSHPSVANQTINQGRKAKSEDPVLQYVKHVISASKSQNPVNDNDKLLTSAGEELNDINTLEAPHEYVAVIGPNGQEVKVSAKFSSIVQLFDGNEEYLDVVIKEAGKWKQVLKEWKNKMTYNDLAPSPANFMDVIELSKLLKEK